MATYPSTPVLSKIKLGNTTYYLKDADARAIIDGFGTAVQKDFATSISGGNDLPTDSAVKSYVDAQIATIHKFDVVIDSKGTESGPSVPASADTMYKIYLVPTGAKSGSYVEWITIREGTEGSYTYKWEKIGTTEVDLSDYVKKTTKIAGLTLENDIAKADLQTALDLKALAYAATASQTVSDYATGVSTSSYTAAGTVAATPNATSTAVASTGKFTPAGSIAGTTTAAGAVAIAKDAENGTQISGTVSAPTVTVTPSTTTIKQFKSAGTLPSVSEVSSSFAVAGLVAALGEGGEGKPDTETLVFSDASKSSALTSTGFNAGSLPEGEDVTSIVNGITSATASAPTFTGDKFKATFTGESADISATFTGTEGDLSVSGNYDKTTSITASFTDTAGAITYATGLTTGNKKITVSPDAE